MILSADSNIDDLVTVRFTHDPWFDCGTQSVNKYPGRNPTKKVTGGNSSYLLEVKVHGLVPPRCLSRK